MAKKKFQPGIYRHSKSGKLYYGLTWAKNSENPNEESVIYIPLYKRKVTDPPAWYRSLKMFTEKVRITPATLVPRFKLVKAISLFEILEAAAQGLSIDLDSK